MQVVVLVLENEKYFLYLEVEDTNATIKECRILYEFVQKHDPIKIMGIIPVTSIFHVDALVKEYMVRYGIDNVRGGSYVDPILPDNIMETLTQELTYCDTYLQDKELIQFIYSQYSTASTWSPSNASAEISRLQSELIVFKSIAEKLENIQYYNGRTLRIDSAIIADLSWIRRRISIPEEETDDIYIDKAIKTDLSWISDWISGCLEETGKTPIPDNEPLLSRCEIVQKYKSILRKLTGVYHNYAIVKSQTDDALPKYAPELYLSRPDVVFDAYFCHDGSDANSSHIIAMESVISKFECMTYTIMNRIEEYTFDLSFYPANYEKLANFAIHYLQSMEN